MQNKRVREIFTKIKQGHFLWDHGDLAYQKRLEKAFEPLFIELEQLDVARHFSQALLFFGAEFVDSLGIDKVNNRGGPTTKKDIELIFGAKVTKMDDKEIREAKLAGKSGALVYRSVPMKGDQVGIKILTHKKK